jgi:hypothetical protein
MYSNREAVDDVICNAVVPDPVHLAIGLGSGKDFSDPRPDPTAFLTEIRPGLILGFRILP